MRSGLDWRDCRGLSNPRSDVECVLERRGPGGKGLAAVAEVRCDDGKVGHISVGYSDRQ